MTDWKKAAVFLALDGAVSYLFFRSVIAFVLLLPGYLIYDRHMKEQEHTARCRRRRKEFLDGLKYVQTALSSGYSMEHAIEASLLEVQKIYPKDSYIVREWSVIVRGVHLNEPLEKLLTQMGQSSGLQEVVEFAEVYSIARVCGGDLTRIVQSTIAGLMQREEVQEEIETILSGKQLEQNMMSMIPLMILGYVRLTSPGFLDPMYESGAGILVMSICLAVYLGAFLLGNRIMRISA